MSLFQTIPGGVNPSDGSRPLADRMRPRTLDEFVGQEHLVGPGKPLRTQIDRDDPGSLIFWGPPGLGKMKLRASADVLKKIASYSSGDARSAYNVLEVAAVLARENSGTETGAEITNEIVQDALQKRILLYDKAGEEHYNLISALHKSVRNSDPDAALYWLGRMLESGEDPLYIARRVVRMSVEDIGLADPTALALCMAG